jgi:hypothetical protein
MNTGHDISIGNGYISGYPAKQQSSLISQQHLQTDICCNTAHVNAGPDRTGATRNTTHWHVTDPNAGTLPRDHLLLLLPSPQAP